MGRVHHRFAAAVLAAGTAVAAAPIASAGVPATITEEGRLFDASGAPLEGSVSITFGVYAAPSGGAPLWAETRTLALDSGYFSAALGELVPFPASLWDGSVRYVGIAAGGDP